MTDPILVTTTTKSPWRKRLKIGCGVLVGLGLVAMIVVNILIKRYLISRIEEGLAEKGFRAEVGELDYSLLRKEIEVRDFKATPTTAKALEKFGTITLGKGWVKINTDREKSRETTLVNHVEEIHLEDLSGRFGSIKKLDVIADQSIAIEGLTINNPSQFGGGPLLNFKRLKFVYAKGPRDGGSSYFSEVRVEIARLTIVRNQQGLWLTDLSQEAEKKVREIKKVSAINNLIITIGEIAFHDLASGGPAQVITVNKEIIVNDQENPRAYQFIILPKLLWIARSARISFGFD